MYCPLFTLGSMAFKGAGQERIDECEEEKCAWWDKDRSCCVEVSKIGAMVTLNSILTEIADKMPHNYFPKK